MFTSRLPKSTSVRRPSNPNDGSTSFMGSNIPVSVRKANLFTPQPHRTLHSSLASTARKSYLTSEKKYQRVSKPMPDSDEQLRMYKELVDFIKSSAPTFNLPDSKRFFSSVSSSEASRIFEFLISPIYPEFKINKLEIDVPEVLGKLGYPYIKSVTKSALVSIASRQAVVNILLIFNWLVTSNKLCALSLYNQENKDIDSIDFVSDKVQQSLAIGQEEADCGVEWLQEAFKQAHPAETHNTNNIEELEKIEKEMEYMEQELENYYQDENFSEIKMEDNKKWKKYIEAMQLRVDGKVEELKNLDSEEIELETRLEQIKLTLENIGSETTSPVDEVEFAKSIAAAKKELETVEADIARYLKQDSEYNFDEKLLIEDQQMEKLQRMFEEDKIRLSEELKAKAEKLTTEEDKDAQKADLERKFFESLIENYKQQALSIVEKEERKTEEWLKIEQVMRDNNKIAKRALKMLRV